MNFLDRFKPKKLRRREPLDGGQRAQWLGNVSEHDPAWRAALDIQEELLEAEFQRVIDPTAPREQVEAARHGLRLAYWTLVRLEDERQRAREAAVAEQEAKRK